MSYRDRITLRQKTTVADDWGQPVETWADVATVWGDVRFLNGKEFIKADKEISQATASVRMRLRAVTTGQRLAFNGKEYEITAVLPERNYVDVVVKEWQQ